MAGNQDLFARRTHAVPQGVGIIHPIFIDKAENAELWDVEGKRYIDFGGGIGVLNVGHRHPKVIEAVQAQLERFTHTCFQVTPYESYIALAERLNGLAPGPAPKKTMLMSSGAEAVENAIKIARAYSKRAAVISFTGGFHGRTMMTLGLTGKIQPYKVGFGPFPGEIYHVPFPNAVHGVSVEHSMQAMQHIFKASVQPEKVAAILIEPVQGEGGFYPAPADFLRQLREVCNQHGILLISDEVQSGAARTGKMFAIEHSGVIPDLITMAKSMAGGFPLSAVIGRADIMDAVSPGGLGGTYAGSPLGCVAALATLDVIEQEGLLDRSLKLGERMRGRFEQMAKRFPCIGDVRGVGSMVAIELFTDAERTQPAVDLTKALVAMAAKHGLILLSCGIHGNVIRVLVPLTASDGVVDEGLTIIEQSLSDLNVETAAA